MVHHSVLCCAVLRRATRQSELTQSTEAFEPSSSSHTTMTSRSGATRGAGNFSNPAVLAVALLNLGTASFVVGVCMIWATTARGSPSRMFAGQLFASFAATVLAFIGGLQQAAGIVDGRKQGAPLVVGGIGLALVAWAIATFGFAAGTPAATSTALALLAGLYAGQGMIEAGFVGRLRPSPNASAVLQVDARRLPMAAAFLTLSLAAFLVGG